MCNFNDPAIILFIGCDNRTFNFFREFYIRDYKGIVIVNFPLHHVGNFDVILSLRVKELLSVINKLYIRKFVKDDP
ncbi:hypothetical protein MHYMCMPASI_00593 [Hyalomma marginatum]|uniref:Uncharacterized protein n=1 Tax=Hyalomma marginatum TaxID=34627 RepID=A0A8S4BWV2_9ACAR|nr:hypothetical protein MHYMCMPASI_00593 [Hyalomma marginatum]